MSAFHCWHWPDHIIGKRESRRLREEHNALVNSHGRLLAACEGLLAQLSGPVMIYGDGRGRDGTKTGLSGQEFNALRDLRMTQAQAAIDAAESEGA